jgi:predicted metal-binding membrane protein
MGLWVNSPAAPFLGHGSTAATEVGALATLGLFVAGWTVMITAMMLPTATGVVATFGRVVRGRPNHLVLQGGVVSGFLIVWLIVGVTFRVGDRGVHAVVAEIAWLGSRPRLIGGTVLVGAGLFQFTALKYRCVTACRSPKSFVYRHWRGERPLADAFAVGVAYGRSCIGCCWALMLLLFALGSASLEWMLALAVVMALEKNGAVGRRLVSVVGVALIVLGATVLLDVWPAPLLAPTSASAVWPSIPRPAIASIPPAPGP